MTGVTWNWSTLADDARIAGVPAFWAAGGEAEANIALPATVCAVSNAPVPVVAIGVTKTAG